MAIAVILGAGSVLVWCAMPKQFWPLEGKTILEHSAEAFLRHPGISEVALVYRKHI
jgi:2-C-methyl-D-erythritol 4-phosphate cytidylyltransferase